MKSLFISSMLLLLPLWAVTQDRHFTQFYAMPGILNPSLTGAFGGKFRATAIYRDQWRGQLEQPYQSFGTALELRFNPFRNSRSGDAAGLGVVFEADKTGPVDFSSNKISLTGAYHKSLDYDHRQYLSAGFAFTAVQQNITFEGLFFQDQYTASNEYSDPTGEILPANNFAYGDLAAGLNYHLTTGGDVEIFAGIALHHILEPEISFYRNDSDFDEENIVTSPLYRKFTLHGGVTLSPATRISVSPRFLVIDQGPHLEITAGSNVIFDLKNRSAAALHTGIWTRVTRNAEDTLNPDALGLMAGIQLDRFLVGLSYDLNIGDLINYSTGQGSFEISLSYFGDYDNEEGMCPVF